MLKIIGRLLLVGLMLLSSHTLAAQNGLKQQVSERFPMQSKMNILLLSPYASYYSDPTASMSFKDVLALAADNKFQPLTPEQINKGVTTESFWVKVVLSNVTSRDIDWVLSHETSYLDTLSVYIKDENHFWINKKVSDFDAFESRYIPYRKLNITHITSANTTTELLINLSMIQPDTITLALNLSDRNSFVKMALDDQIFYGVYFGICIAFILISFIIWVKVKQKTQVSYIIYLLMNMIFWSFLTGHAFQYLLADHPIIYNQAFHIAYLVFFISATQFSRHFLNIRQHLPKINQLISGLQVIALVAIVARLLGVYEAVLYISFLGLLLLTLLPIIGWFCYKKGESAAKWYIVAWSVFGLGILLSVLSASTSWFSWGMEPLFYTQIAALFETLLLMMAVAERISQMKIQLSMVQEESKRDALTGLGNRRMLETSFEQIKLNSNLLDLNHWIMLIDIDDFKIVNDTHGHMVGDEVLKVVASVLNQSCRPEDVLVRYGGEEFIILMEAADEKVMSYIAKRVREAIEYSVVDTSDAQIRITISIGVAPVVTINSETALYNGIENADKALYFVKEKGKNQIGMFHESGCTLI